MKLLKTITMCFLGGIMLNYGTQDAKGQQHQFIYDNDQQLILPISFLQDSREALILVEPCLSSHLLILKAHEKNYKIVVLTADKDMRKIPLNAKKMADILVVVDTNNDDLVLDAVKKIKSQTSIAGVIPGAEYYVPLTAKLQSVVGGRGLSYDAALAVRKKHLMRSKLKEKGVKIPLYQVVHTREELLSAVEKIGFPCIIKPVDLAGSVLVRKVNTFQEALTVFENILSKSGKDQAWGNRELSQFVLVEEYIKGKEYSVEGVIEDGQPLIFSVTEKLLSPEPHFVEVGHIIPAQTNPELKAKIKTYLEKITNALELGSGPFHAELRLSSQGPILMEIAMRLAGDYIPMLIEEAYGIDLYEQSFNVLTGKRVNTNRTKKLNAGITFFYRPELKTLKSTDYFNQIKKFAYVRGVKSYYKAGDTIPDLPMEKHKLGYAILVDEDYETLIKKIKEIEALADFTAT